MPAVDQYREFCDFLGLNPYHPDEWSPEERGAYTRWRLRLFRAHWRWRMELGDPAIIRKQAGREALVELVRAGVRDALAPPRSRPFAVCPCHPRRLGDGAGRRASPWSAGPGPAAERALKWLQTEFGPRVESAHEREHSE